MGDNVDEQPIKKRSLSSYLSNVSTRREELEKIAKEQKLKEEEDQILLEKERVRLEKERAEKERAQKENNLEENPSKGSDMDKNTVSTVKSEQQSDTNGSNESLLDDADQSKFSKDQKANDEESPELNRKYLSLGLGSISRSDLQGMLKEPSKKSFSDSDDSEDDSDHFVVSDDEILSDAPTEPESPPKPRLTRLVRSDQLPKRKSQTEKTTFDNNTDSDLSDIEDYRNTLISSSVFADESFSIKEDAHALHSSPNKIRSRRKSPKPDRKKTFNSLSGPRATKPRKSIYRDAGGRSKLQIACDKGKYETVKKLLEEGEIDVNDQDNAGNSSLHEAALNGYLDCVKLLIEHGANVNLISYEMFKDTPLIDAAANGHLDVVKYLIKHGADPTVTNTKGLTAYESIEDDANYTSDELEEIKSIKECLREATKSWKLRNSDETKPTQLRQTKSNDKYIDEHAAEDQFYWTDITSRAGQEKLFRAAKDGNLTYVGLYLENGGRADFKSFVESVRYGHEDIASLFLAFGAHVNSSLSDGTTPLMAAVGRGHVNIVKLLIEAGADTSRVDKRGNNALFYSKNSATGMFDEAEIRLLVSDAGMEKLDLPHSKSDQTNERSIEDRKHELSDIGSDNDSKHDIPDQHINKKQKFEVVKTGEEIAEEAAERQRMEEEGRRLKELEAEEEAKRIVEEERSRKEREEEEKKRIIEEDIRLKKEKEEEEARLDKLQKEEEEYKMKRLQQKKKREQEILQKLAEDELKRETEKEKQKLKESKRLEDLKLKKEQELTEQRKETELNHRRQVRELYPIGLKLIDYYKQDDTLSYLPLYYVMKPENDAKYVLNLQILLFLKDNKFEEECGASTEDILEITSTETKSQLWNIFKFIFLNGGYNNEKKLNFSGLDLKTRIQFEHNEYLKFSSLPMNWINFEKLDFTKYTHINKQQLLDNMIPIELNETTTQRTSDTNSVTTSTSTSNHRNPKHLPQFTIDNTPIKFQHRKDIARLLNEVTASTTLW